jgi:hypothetical protein
MLFGTGKTKWFQWRDKVVGYVGYEFQAEEKYFCKKHSNAQVSVWMNEKC